MAAKEKKISYAPFEQPVDAPEFDNEKVNILLVDDLPEKILSYEAVLDDLGQNLIIARSGEEALKLVLKHEFAVILLDVNMPGMDGFEAASLIRSRKKCAHTPIIFLTAFPDEIRMAQGYASGAVDYLLTPVVPEILQAKVKVFIELSQMKKQAASQAEEKAMRKAAEDSACRFQFLVFASETLARAKNLTEALSELVKLPVPYFADVSMVYLADAKDKAIVKWAWIDESENISAEPLLSSLDELSWLKKMIDKAMVTGQIQTIANIPVPIISQESPATKISGAALIAPLFVHDLRSGVVALFRKGPAYGLNDLAMAPGFTSRASIALENVMLLEKIQEADHRKDEFLATLAHELRNPLAPIRNALAIMRMSKDPRLHEQSEEIIARQLEHMIHLVDDLMDISRITQGKIELRKEPVKLNDVLNHAIETAEPLINERKHKLAITFPKETLWLNADFSRISQIFSNLFNNAAKYTNDGGKIEVSVQHSGEWAVISVSDNGIGISNEMLSRIFDMFSQVDSSLERTQGGLGIGLTLVKSLVEMHEGTIEAISSGLDKGSKFIVKLPIIKAPAADKKEEASLANESQVVPLRVLVVDDNDASAKTLGWMIELAGHEIKLAHDGKSAIETARTYQPEVILLDIGLPGMNGYEACRIMKTMPELQNSTFIAQTGWGQVEHRQFSKEVGFDHHLVKPISMDDLHKLLAGLRSSQSV